jgi:hypothetical protein
MMNPALLVLIAIGVILIYLLASFLYRPIGNFFYRILKDAEEAIKDEEEENNEDE